MRRAALRPVWKYRCELTRINKDAAGGLTARLRKQRVLLPLSVAIVQLRPYLLPHSQPFCWTSPKVTNSSAKTKSLGVKHPANIPVTSWVDPCEWPSLGINCTRCLKENSALSILRDIQIWKTEGNLNLGTELQKLHAWLRKLEPESFKTVSLTSHIYLIYHNFTFRVFGTFPLH